MTIYEFNVHYDTEVTLDDLKGKYVRVCIVPDAWTRNSYGPQIAVAAKLEIKRDPDNRPHYRVKCNDDNFTYFEIENVILINLLASKPTIYLSIPVEVFQEPDKIPE